MADYLYANYKVLQNVDQLGKIRSDMKSATDNSADKSACLFCMQRNGVVDKKAEETYFNWKAANTVLFRSLHGSAQQL